MTEQEFIQKQQARLDASLLRKLRLVNNDPCSVKTHTIELLLPHGLIEFGGPSEACQYNHYRLTAQGRGALAELESQTPAMRRLKRECREVIYEVR